MLHLTQQQQQQQQQQAVAPPAVTFKQFQAVKPPEFKGSVDPVEANAWLKEMEKAFELVGAGTEQKTKGDLTVAEYEAKFTELARFVPDQVDTDEKKARRFEQGLKFWILNRVAMFELTSYVAVVQKAMVIESKSDMSQKGKDGKKRKIETSEGGQQQGNFQGHFNKRPEFQGNRNVGFRRPQSGNGGKSNHFQNSNQQRPNLPPVPDCQFCGRKHFGNCIANVTCFKYGRKGHFANVCQNPTQGQNVGTDC
ncbi:hypothetical protein AgCh_017835 [Apium graveolens]